MGILDQLPPDMLEDAVAEVQGSPDLQEYLQLLDESAYSTFIPRPDRPELFDQQAGFCYSKDLVAFLVGGNACIAGDSRVFDPVKRSFSRVDQILGPFHVWSVDADGNRQLGVASRPFFKRVDWLWDVVLSTGRTFAVAGAHRLLCSDRKWRCVADLSVGDCLASIDAKGKALPGIQSKIRRAEKDGIWDFTVKKWRNYEMGGVIHHNSGTTEASAFKVAKFLLLDQPPPRPDTPFWVITSTYDQCCGICWLEKLLGNGHIPSIEVDWKRTRWFREKDGWPFAIHLKPWPRDRKGGNGRNSWMLEFKSYEQGRTAFHAKSIGGFWFSEQFPWQLFVETLRGCRDYMFRGGQMCEFTPIDPELCYHLEKVMDDPPKDWGFYRANTDCNRVNLADGWFDSFFGAVPDEMQETRRTGALATFEGVIYPTFNPAIHVVRGETRFPVGVRHYRGVDWGASAEHPFVCIWAYVDAIGDWYVYEEYWSDSQARITLDHVVAIVEKSQTWGWPGHWLGEGEREQESKIGPVWVPKQRDVYRDTYADPSRPGEINEFGNRGIPVSAAANDVYKGIDTVRTLLKLQTNGKPKLVIHERCVHLVEEMRKYRWKRGKKSLVSGGSILNPQVAAPVPLKLADDAVDSLRYLLHTHEISKGLVPTKMSHREWDQQRKSIPMDLRSGGRGAGPQLERGRR